MNKSIRLISQWVREFFTTCSLKKKFTVKDPPFLLIGHRGSPAQEVENTIPSFERAIREGANGLELDLCLTNDGYVVIWHDWDPNDAVPILRESGFEPFIKHKPFPPSIGSEFRRKISTLSLKEFRANFMHKAKGEAEPIKVHIPTLQEFFEWTRGKENLKFVCLDIKTPDDEELLAIEILKQVNCFIDDFNPTFTIIIETASRKIHDVMKNAFPHFNYSLDIEPHAGIVLDPVECSAIKAAHELGNTYAIAMRPRKITIANFTTYRRIIKHDVRLLRRIRSEYPDCKIQSLIGATISKKKEMKCLVRAGIEGIQTDFPARLQKILVKYNRHVA